MLNLRTSAALAASAHLASASLPTIDCSYESPPAEGSAQRDTKQISPRPPTTTAIQIPKPEEVVRALESSWGRVSSIAFDASIEVQVNERRENSPYNIKDSILIARHGGFVWKDSQYGPEEDLENLRFRRVIFYDSSTNTSGGFQIRGREGGVTERGVADEIRRVLAFQPFAINAHAALRAAGEIAPESVIDVLKSGWATIRPQAEVCDDVPCIVVDVHRPNTCQQPGVDGRIPKPSEFKEDEKHLWITMWLDPERGFLPLHQQKFELEGRMIVEIRALETCKTDQGFWFVTRAKHEVYPPVARVSTVVSILKDQQGQTRIDINNPVNETPSPENLLRLPSGFKVYSKTSTGDLIEREWPRIERDG